MLGFKESRRICAVLLVCAIFPASTVQGQTQAGAATATETLTYLIEWRLITAGTAKLQSSRSHLNLRLESAGLVSKLYKVDDTYATTYESDLCASSLHLMAQEGRRRRETRVTYDRARNRADYLERDLVKNATVKQDQIETPHCVHDVAGALFALRNMRIDVGKSAEMPVSDGKKAAMVRVEAQEREVVKIKGQAVKTVRYEAFLFNNVIYSRSARLFVWLSDDSRKLPVQIQIRMNFPIGTVTLTLDKEEHS